jgi:hypothetical protein
MLKATQAHDLPLQKKEKANATFGKKGKFLMV